MNRRHLLLLRHAKSSWDDAALDDHDRPLSARGEAAARALGGYFARRALRPDLALCSSARRTRDTLAQLALDVPARFERALYLASHEALLARLARIDDEHRCVLLVGHNPGLADLVAALAGETRLVAARRLAKGMKTASLAELDLPLRHWEEIKPGVGRLVRLTRPKDLGE